MVAYPDAPLLLVTTGSGDTLTIIFIVAVVAAVGAEIAKKLVAGSFHGATILGRSALRAYRERRAQRADSSASPTDHPANDGTRRHVVALLVQVVVSFVAVVAAVLILTLDSSSDTMQQAAAGWLGLVLGYWLH